MELRRQHISVEATHTALLESIRSTMISMRYLLLGTIHVISTMISMMYLLVGTVHIISTMISMMYLLVGTIHVISTMISMMYLLVGTTQILMQELRKASVFLSEYFKCEFEIRMTCEFLK